MITRVSLAGLAAAFIAAPVLAATPPPLDTYRLSPVVENGKVTALSVTITLPADADGETRLRLPADWGGGEKLWRFIKDLTVTGGEVSAPDDATRIVMSKPRAPLTIRYRVVSAYDGEPPPGSITYAQPIIGPDGVYVAGQTIFVHPDRQDQDRVRFAWDPADSGLRIASDLERMAKTPGTLQDLVSSVVLADRNLTVLTRTVDGAPLRVAVSGTFDFTDDAFADMAAQTIGAVRAFWGDGREPFLVTLAPLNAPAGWSAFRGTGQGDAFMVISTRNRTIADHRLFLAHEYFHTWNPVRLGGSIKGPDEPLGYWFSEGFTDYYARRLALRAGLIDLEAFVSAWNEALKAYATSPARAAPNAEIAARTWSDSFVHRLPYDRGSLFAVLTARRLRGQGGLDPVMLALRDQARRKDPAERGDAASLLFPRVVRDRTGIDLAPDIERWITRGEPIVLPPDAFGGCLTVESARLPAYDAGFDRVASGKTRIVTGVDPNGPAYAAGLRDGMTYLGSKDGKTGDATLEVTQVVRDGGTTRMIRYLPKGRGEISLQRVVMPGDLTPEARAACVKAVAG